MLYLVVSNATRDVKVFGITYFATIIMPRARFDKILDSVDLRFAHFQAL